ncbi:MAG: hypothetical protein HKN03_09205 [Acidimicrobiales bacterium]|nr:hypothetical protein [Acidimicrobiales bacterium]
MEQLDLDAIIERYKERANAVKRRNLPPVGGDERKAFIQQAEQDFLDYSLIADSTATLQDGILTFTVDLRSS